MSAKRIIRGFLITIGSLVGLALVTLIGWNLVRTAVEPASALAKASTEKAAPAKPEAVAAKPAVPAKPTLVAQEAAKPQASTTTTTTTTHGGWTVTCSEGGDPVQKTCSANFRVMNKDNQQTVLVWLLGRNAEGKLMAEFVTPSDILIKPGVAMTLDDAEAVKAEYLSCTVKQGCRASVELTPELAQQLKTTKKAKIGLTMLNGKVMEIGMDIPGVDGALTDLGA